MSCTYRHRLSAALPLLALATLAACGDESPFTSSTALPETPAPALAKGGPNAPPVNGRIYFAALITGQFDLYSMKPDGSDRRRLTFTLDADEWQPDVSPDGKKLTYLARRTGQMDIYAINTDGTGTRRLTDFNADESDFFSLRSPRWTPDGRRIVFSARDAATQHSRLYIMNATGTAITPLTDPATLPNVIDPDLSPDGNSIVFSQFDGANTFEVKTMPFAGGPATTLGGCGDTYCYRPQWSPDGSRIMTETNGVRIYQYLLAPTPWQGFVTTNNQQVFGGGVGFAPDGSKFVYSDINLGAVVADVSGYNAASIATGMSMAGMTWGK